MRYRQLGDSDLKVSEISLGSWLTYGGGVGDDGRPRLRRRGVRRRDQLHRHRERLRPRRRGGLPRRRPAEPPARLLRARDQALLPDGRHGHEPGPLARAGREADRRLAAPPAHRLRRPLPVPPLRPQHAARGDDGRAERRRELGQGALPRLQRVERAADPGRARPEPRQGLREVRLLAAAVLDAAPRSGAGGLPAVQGERHLADRLVATRPGRPHRQVQAGSAAAGRLARDKRRDGRLHGQLAPGRRARAGATPRLGRRGHSV